MLAVTHILDSESREVVADSGNCCVGSYIGFTALCRPHRGFGVIVNCGDPVYVRYILVQLERNLFTTYLTFLRNLHIFHYHNYHDYNIYFTFSHLLIRLLGTLLVLLKSSIHWEFGDLDMMVLLSASPSLIIYKFPKVIRYLFVCPYNLNKLLKS